MPAKPKKAPPSEMTLGEVLISMEKALSSLTKAGLNERAVVALLHDKTKISKTTLTKVLQAMKELQSDYGK